MADLGSDHSELAPLDLLGNENRAEARRLKKAAFFRSVDAREIMKVSTKAPSRRANGRGHDTEGVTSMQRQPTNDGLILRTARKRWECRGDGRATNPQHSPDCPHVIEPGDRYIECVWEATAYESGSRHALVCAKVTHGYVASDEKEVDRG